MAKKLDLKAKAKRDKIIAAVGGVVLLGVLAFAIPMTMNHPSMIGPQIPPMKPVPLR